MVQQQAEATISEVSQPQEPQKALNLRPGEHVLMAGTTGSGKTTLAKSFLSARTYVISIDTKHDNRWDGFVITSDINRIFRRRRGDNGRYIFRPEFGLRGIMQIAEICDRAYREGGWNVHFDELYQCTARSGTSQGFPPPLVRIWTAGRSKGVTGWGCTQRPKFIPIFCMSESTHFFLFELGNKEDLKHVAKMSGVDKLAVPMSGHQFLYYNRRSQVVQRMVLDTDE